MLFAIGDIHGCAFELRALLNKLSLAPDSTVVFLGDYIDRGAHSRAVIDTVIELGEYCNVVALMGNHESMFIDFLENPTSTRAGLFIVNGGSSTLAGYADERGNYTIPAAHVEFLRRLALFHQTDENFFVHAGVPDIPLSQITYEEHREHLLWMRGAFLRSTFTWEKVVVHGHTPVPAVQISPNRINIDTGCVFHRRLTAMSFPDMRVYSVRRQRVEQPVYLRDQYSRRRALRFKGAVPIEVRRGSEVFHCETVDYSEVGLYMRDLSNAAEPSFEADEIIEGMIGANTHGASMFRGQIVRVDRNVTGLYYAVKLLPR